MKASCSNLPAIVSLALLLSAPCLSAQDWPQWRGPNRDGKVTGFAAPESWPQQLKQQWKVAIGAGDTTPALVGDRLFTHGRSGTDEVVNCLDAASGSVIWSNVYPADYVVTGPPARHPGPRSSPVVADGKVCTLGVGGILSCFDAAKGTLLWRKQSTNDYLGAAYRSDTAMSPIVVDGLCVVQVGGKEGGTVIAFQLASGEPKWKWAGDSPVFASPVFMTVDGKQQLLFFTSKALVALGASDGQLLWQQPVSAQRGINVTPIVDGQTIFYTAEGKGLAALKVEKGASEFTVTPLWNNAQLTARFTTPVLRDGRLYGFTARFFCADAKTGETIWTSTANDGQSAAVLDAGSVILGLTWKADLVAFKPGEKEYNELVRIKVASTDAWAHPVVAGKRIYVRDADSVTLWTLD